MKSDKNMEDFLREKLGHREEDFADDWPVFEQKLERALFFKQMRVGALVGMVLIILSIGFFGSSSFSKFNVFQSGNMAHQEETSTGQNVSPEQKSTGVAGVSNELNEENSNVEQAEPIASQEKPIASTGSVEVARVAETGSVDEGSQATQIMAANESDPENSISDAPATEVAASEAVAFSNAEETSVSDEVIAEDIVIAPVASEVVTMAPAEAAPDEKDAAFVVVLPQVGSDNLAIVSESEVADESPGINEENEVKASPKRGTASHGMALIPTGNENFEPKLNVKPIELMVDIRDVKTMSLRGPVIPMKLTQAEDHPYVSPYQEKKPWSYSVKVYPNYTFRKFTVAPDKMPYIHRDFIDQVEVSESGSFSLNVGFEASKRIGFITYLNAGVEYINYKTEANFDFMNYRDAVVNTASGKITSYNMRNNPEHIVITDANRYEYLNFPLSISYRPWATDHVRLNIEAGASYMYFMRASGKSIDYQTLEIIDIGDREYRKSVASICFKVGASYFVSEQFSLGFEPTVVYFSNTIYADDYPFEVVPYSVGVNFKLQMKLN